jgi:hypothetical protein
MEVIDSDERMTKRMSRRGGRGSVEAGGVMAVEKQKQMQPESERACRRGRGRGDTTGRRHEVGRWVGLVGLVEPLGNCDGMMRSPAWGQEQAADWLQIGIRGCANRARMKRGALEAF